MAGLFALVPVLFLVALRVLDGGKDTDCAKVRDPSPGVWQAGDYDVREPIARDLSLCRRLQGRTSTDVETLLGPPTSRPAGELRYRLASDAEAARGPERSAWRLFVGADGRVSDVTLFIDTGS